MPCRWFHYGVRSTLGCLVLLHTCTTTTTKVSTCSACPIVPTTLVPYFSLRVPNGNVQGHPQFTSEALARPLARPTWSHLQQLTVLVRPNCRQAMEHSRLSCAIDPPPSARMYGLRAVAANGDVCLPCWPFSTSYLLQYARWRLCLTLQYKLSFGLLSKTKRENWLFSFFHTVVPESSR